MCTVRMSTRPVGLIVCVVVLCVFLGLVSGHGRLAQPPGRASAWRYGFATPADYDDDGANCGGASHQWANGGRCGICGDPYDAPEPRAHELGGTYGLGVIVDSYHAGQLIDVTVQLTASHLGFFEISLCTDPHDNSQSCFDKHPLELAQGGYRHPVLESRAYRAQYRLPPGLSCAHCVLQWRYTAGNNWGVCANGTGALGCGPQEQFFGCADITIEADEYDTNSVLGSGSRLGNRGNNKEDYRGDYKEDNRGDYSGENRGIYRGDYNELNKGDYSGENRGVYRGDYNELNKGDYSGDNRGDYRGDHRGEYRKEEDNKGDYSWDDTGFYKGDYREDNKENNSGDKRGVYSGINRGFYRGDHRGDYRGNNRGYYRGNNRGDYRRDNRLGNLWGKWGFSWF